MTIRLFARRQAEAERKELEDKLAELESLDLHCRKLKERLAEVKSWGMVLENHRNALLYAQAEEDARRVAEARDLRDRVEHEMTALERICAKQPAREEVERKIKAIETYREDLAACQAEESAFLERPQPPVQACPPVFSPCRSGHVPVRRPHRHFEARRSC